MFDFNRIRYKKLRHSFIHPNIMMDQLSLHQIDKSDLPIIKNHHICLIPDNGIRHSNDRMPSIKFKNGINHVNSIPCFVPTKDLLIWLIDNIKYTVYFDIAYVIKKAYTPDYPNGHEYAFPGVFFQNHDDSVYFKMYWA